MQIICKLALIVMLMDIFVRRSSSQEFLTSADFRLAFENEPITFLTESDFDNARKYKELIAVTKARRNILTQQPFYRGDIRGKAAWRKERRQRLRWHPTESSPINIRFNGVASGVKKWPSGRIPYVLSSDYNERERAVLARAFQEYHGRTCIRFVPKTSFDRDYLFIGKIDGCYSDVGRAGGRQELSLDNGCLHVDTVIHELVSMHSVGFYHEHERWDRDNYLFILWANIDNDAVDQFGRVDLVESSYYDQPYDYHSIMHYDSLAFSKNGHETLVAKEPTMTAVIGSAIDFSTIDLAKIHRMYQCPGFETDSIASNFEFVGDNSIAGPTPAIPPQGIVDSLSRLQPSNIAGSLNLLEPKGHPIAMPYYLTLNRPVARGPTINGPIKNQQQNQNKRNCSDRTILCGYWLSYCHAISYQKVMRDLCALTCNLCDQPSRRPTISRKNPNSFLVFANVHK